jgi:glutaredoxin
MDEIIYLNSIVHYGIMKNIIILGIIMLLFLGCIGNSASSISQEEIEKLVNGTDKKNISVDVLVYHGEECPHCKNTISLLDLLNKSYSINMTLKETWHNETNANLMFADYERFGMKKENGGVPTMIIEDRMMVIGSLSVKSWVNAIEDCGTGRCQSGIFYEDPASGNIVRME